MVELQRGETALKAAEGKKKGRGLLPSGGTRKEHGNWTFLKRGGKRFISDDESKFRPI